MEFYIKNSISKTRFFVNDTLTRNDNVILREEDTNRTKTKNSARWIDITPEVKQILENPLKNYIIKVYCITIALHSKSKTL